MSEQMKTTNLHIVNGSEGVRISEAAQIDGRRRRSARSRAAIVTATLNLLDSGNLAPTAKQIAAEAGVGLRSFFRHFEDMDALLDAVDEHMRQYYEQLFSQPPGDGSMDERIVDIITYRAEAYERLKKMMQSTMAHLWRSEMLQKNYGRNQRNLSRHFDKWLPEFKSMPREKYEAAHAAASFEMWHRLRQHQKLNISEARETVIAILRGLAD